ncbi:MAG TPA: DUF2262 domain-containing protein [Telluria sp.]|jgi:hypothetical protein
MSFFDDAIQKRKQLQALYVTLPTVTLTGVVGPGGASGGRIPPEAQWSLNADLMAWRVGNGSIRETPLIVSKSVSDDELHVLQRAIQPDSIISFEAKLCESSPFGDARAELVQLLDAQAGAIDPVLERILANSIAPVEISDPVFGRLILNRRVGWFEGQVKWLGKTIDVALSAEGENDIRAAIQSAHAFLDSMLEWSQKINNLAVAELLDLKNECWLDEGEQDISKAEFLERMQPASFTVYPDGSFEFWHDDGELFWGHSILISGSLFNGVGNASIAG